MSRGQGQSSVSSSEQDLQKRFNTAMGSAKISKIAFAVLGTIGSGFPFLEYLVAPSPEALISGVSLSLAISLAYIVFYSLQILPSFSSAEPYSILMTLPLDESEFSFIATLSLIRTFDYIAASAIVVQVFSIWLLTHSLVASALMFAGSIANVIFALAIALWFSGLFYKNVSRGGRSRKATLGRLLFLVTWGIAALSIGFIFNFVSYLLPYLTSAILGMFAKPVGLVLLVLHPFSLGFAITDVVYPTLFSSIAAPIHSSILIPRYVPPILTLVATFGYFALSIEAGRRIVNSVSRITRGLSEKIARPMVRDFAMRIRSPFLAYVVKDLRLASVNPSLAFLYAAPFFEVLALAALTVQFPVMRATAMIISTIVGCFFTTMICSTLLNTEGAGLEYTLSLPLGARTMIDAKAMVAALTFVPVPLALLGISLSKQVASSYILLIPVAELIAVFAACMGEIAFFLWPEKSKNSMYQSRGFSVMAGSDITRLVKSLVIAFTILLIPILIYAVTYLGIHSHEDAIITMISISVVELLTVFVITR